MSIKGLLQTIKDTLKSAGHQLAAKEELMLTGLEKEFTGLKGEIANLVQRVYNLETSLKGDIVNEASKLEAKVESEIPLSSTSMATTTTAIPAPTPPVAPIALELPSSAPISKAEKLALKAHVTKGV
jgi:hypothetical protein